MVVKKKVAKTNSRSTSRVRSLEPPMSELQISDTEKAYGVQLANELTGLQVVHSNLEVSWLKAEAGYNKQKAQLLVTLQKKQEEQVAWLRRTAQAHGIDVEAEGAKWRLDLEDMRFRPVS